jgi:hypothetical protein
VAEELTGEPNREREPTNDVMIVWLRAQLDVDELLATRARHEWAFDSGGLWAEVSDETAAHVRNQDPAHVLAVVAAHRRILDEYVAAKAELRLPDEVADELFQAGRDRPRRRDSTIVAAQAERIGRFQAMRVSFLAVVAAYAHRPGYRPEWAL